MVVWYKTPGEKLKKLKERVNKMLDTFNRVEEGGRMRFIFSGDHYGLEFQRNKNLVVAYGEHDGKEIMSTHASTTVMLLKLDPKEKGSANSEVILAETAGCYYKDKFDLERGRKAAIERLVKTGKEHEKISRAMAGLIWKAYFSRLNKHVSTPGSGGVPVPLVDSNMVSELVH